MVNTFNINVVSVEPLVSPNVIREESPITEAAADTVATARQGVADILAGDDDRLIAVVGPCSIHDEKAAMEYAQRLADLSAELADRLLVVMRVYFEKPRTTIGWKGLINDPYMDGTFDIVTGLRRARALLVSVNAMGLPAGTEMLDPISPQYTADLVAWASIGARTTESQTHREMASGLSMPIGYKNGTDGNIQTAVDAMVAARSPHSFLGIDLDGATCIINTRGNALGHLILRGGKTGPNYSAEHLEVAADMMIKAGLPPCIMVDCSHANSIKDHRKQEQVVRHTLEQVAAGNRNIVGVMIESNLHEGNQPIAKNPAQLRYGVSVTDACIGWEKTEELLRHAHKVLGGHRATVV